MDLLGRLIGVLALGGAAGTFCVGTAMLGSRLYLGNRGSRVRALLWSAVPLVGGGALALLDGPSEYEMAGLLLLGGIVTVGSWIAIALSLSRQVRAFTGTVLFEALAAFVWGVGLVEVARSLTQGGMN